MRNLKYLVLLIATAMFLAACGGGTGNGGTTPPPDETGTLVIEVTPNSAQVTVTDSEGAQVAQETGDFTVEDLDAGTYSVSATADGYLDYGPQSVNVPAGETATFTFDMTEEAAVPQNVDSIELGFVDVDGFAYETAQEVNPVKDATLVAAQTEEMVGVSVLVLDEQGEPVANAPVTVSVTGDFSSALAIYQGKATEAGVAATETFQGLSTDEDGMVYFIIEATNADLSVQEILNVLLDDFGGFSGPVRELDAQQDQEPSFSVFEPIKLIVSAVGNNNVAKRVEFKSFFTNMSHLWYGEGTPQSAINGIQPTGFGFADLVILDEDSLVYTDQRLGADLGTIVNIWSEASTADNAHYFGTWALTKQPSSGPFRVGIGNFSDILLRSAGASGYPNSLSGAFFGYMEYELTGGDTDLVEWDQNFCENDLTVDPTICIDRDGSGVSLNPVTGVQLEDLPIEVDVQATYYFTVTYGETTYEFALKDYTFTKQWVGGFLTVDKYVDQHVLTWSGSEITLASNSATYDEEYTSKAHVTVTNDSNSDIYNVTVRDAVPAELGVVTDSISENGTYDAVNHVVTWNYTNTPSLENILVGDSVEFTFDVYARHKPGYCWTGEDDGSFDVQPRESDPVTDEEFTTCEFPYEDPYLTTNGAENNTVTAAGFFEDDITGEQLVFSYQPQADESDVWVVRPLFAIDKTLRSQEVMTRGASATFGITARQIDRVETDLDPDPEPNTEAYAFLDALYPWEFRGDLAAGTGHVAPESDVRDNPYARDVVIADAWEVGIDFTNGTDFTNVTGGILDASGALANKEVSWSAIDDLPRGTTAEAILTLTGNLLSDDGTGAPQNNAETDTGDANQTTQGLYHWDNCMYLDAPQLNQPFVETAEYLSTWYADEMLGPWDPYFQIDGTFVLPNELVSDADPAATETTRTFSDGAIGYLEDCASVVVIPPPPTPFVTLTTNGEYFGAGEDATNPNITADNLRDGYTINEDFVYKLTIQNAGGLLAENVEFSATLSNSVVRFNGTATLYVSTTGANTSWSGPLQSVPVNNSGSFAFAPQDLAAGSFFRVVIESTSRQVGIVDMVGEVVYDNAPASQTLPLQVIEETSVQSNP